MTGEKGTNLRAPRGGGVGKEDKTNKDPEETKGRGREDQPSGTPRWSLRGRGGVLSRYDRSVYGSSSRSRVTQYAPR